MANNNNVFYDTITNKRTVPYNSTKTGTIQTVGTDVIGTGTLFTTEVKVGDFLVDLTQNEVHKVVQIQDNTNMYIQEAFTVNLPAATAVVISPSVPRPKEISLLVPVGNPDGKINGKTLIAGAGFNVSKMAKDINGRPDFVDTIVVDATGTSMVVQINY